MKNKTLNEFTILTSSKDPVPGGGGVSALVSSLAISLSKMVTSLTSGKKKYAEYQTEIEDLANKTESLRIELLDAINKDAECFLPLQKTYSMPKDNEGYTEKMEECLKLAASSPYNILKLTTRIIEIDERLSIIGSKLSVSDAGTSVMLASGALHGAYINILVNTKLMKDKDYANKLEKKAKEILDEYTKRAKICYENIIERL